MRASPLLQWAVFLFAWALLAVPITAITRTRAAVAQVDTIEQTVAAAWVSIRFSATPTRFSLIQNNQVLWESPTIDGRKQFEREVPIVFDAMGTEFWLNAELPGNGGVVEISVEASGRDARAQTLWVDGDSIDAPLSFTWGANE